MDHDTTAKLPAKITKRIEGTCIYSGCREPSVDGDHCAPHDAHEKGRARGKARRSRTRLAEAGRCIVSGCGATVRRRRRADGSIMLRRCRRCAKDDRDTKRARRRRVPGDSCRVPGDSQISAAEVRTRVESDGYVRTLALGRAKRGAPSTEDRRRDAMRSLADAKSLIERFERARSLVEAEAADLPRIQREAARRSVVELLERAARMIEDAAELY